MTDAQTLRGEVERIDAELATWAEVKDRSMTAWRDLDRKAQAGQRAGRRVEAETLAELGRLSAEYRQSTTMLEHWQRQRRDTLRRLGHVEGPELESQFDDLESDAIILIRRAVADSDRALVDCVNEITAPLREVAERLCQLQRPVRVPSAEGLIAQARKTNTRVGDTFQPVVA